MKPNARPLDLLRLLVVVAVLGCGACKPSADKVADLVKQGQAQEQAGDDVAAAKSFREALKLDSESIDARRALAALLFAREDLGAARSEYLAIRERLPEDLDANLSLAEIALAQYDAATAETFLSLPRTADAASSRTRAAVAALAFYQADAAGDDTGRDKAVDEAKAVLKEAPDSFVARRIILQYMMNGADPEAALPYIEDDLKKRPKSLELNMMKLNVLSKRQGSTAGPDQLKAMYRDFPDNADIQSWLTDWYLAAGAPDETVSFLRDVAARNGDDPSQHARIADYVVARYPAGEAAAKLGDLKKAYPVGPVSDLYLSHEAAARFSAGEKDQAIKLLRDLLARRPATTDPVAPMTALARMLDETGQREEARKLVDQAIGLGAGSLPAQLLSADWSMQDKDYHGAVLMLLQARTAAPDNPDVLVRLGRAQDADGAPELASEAFAKAVEVSGNGVQESIAFAELLLRLGKRDLAETVIQTALKTHPDDTDLAALATKENLALPNP